MATRMIHVRVDEELRERAALALSQIGLSTSDAVRLLFHRIVADQAFPLDLKVPNAETRAAMEEADRLAAADRARLEAERATPDHGG